MPRSAEDKDNASKGGMNKDMLDVGGSWEGLHISTPPRLWVPCWRPTCVVEEILLI